MFDHLWRRVSGYEQIGCYDRVYGVMRGSWWHWLPAFLLAPVLGILSLVLPVFIYRLPLEETSPLFPVLATGVEHLSALTLVFLFISGAILSGVFKHPASWVASMVVMGAMPIVILADVIADSTSHNLLPFELAQYGALSLVALFGAGVGVAVRRAVVRTRGVPR